MAEKHSTVVSQGSRERDAGAPTEASARPLDPAPRELIVAPERARLVDFGMGDYERVLRLQEELRERRRRDEIPDTWLFGEHPYVITQGVRATPQDIVVSRPPSEGERSDLAPKSGVSDQAFGAPAPVVQVDRGGMTTIHSPGQLILYPIVRVNGGSLAAGRLSRALLRTMRDWIAAEFGVEAEIPPRRPGLYVGPRKLLSIGISVRHDVSMHGIALNLCNDVSLWSAIVACGEPTTQPITLSEIVGREVKPRDLYEPAAGWLQSTWGYNEVVPEKLEER